ncbi:glycoside hydrolase family 63 protein [Sporormia fimetaria CBS 119925]|uniref:Mannosyl-oligosaccharide glucosidase n=1 Tax=Sporormia fimetaria CBS 119925 TaxID=1340428 RepID=A0A6A6V7H5_9PLEO|nr:glycoside hydrolase family 63 protein [Sporormia fimetaria CBS 119925]
MLLLPLLYSTLLLLVPVSASPDLLPSPAYNTSLLWGPYRPNVRFGIRPRVPQSLFMGIMWYNFDVGHKSRGIELPQPTDRQYGSHITDLRHTCENDSIQASGYGWTAYDPRVGGTQLIPDPTNKINITTEFVKISEGQNRGNWGARVKVTPREDAPPGLRTAMVFYVGMEGMENCSTCRLGATEGRTTQRDDHAVRKTVFWTKHPQLGISEIHLLIPKHEFAAVKSLNVTEDVLWQSKGLYVELLKDNAIFKDGQLVLPNELGKGNAHFVQMVFSGPFEAEIIYNSHESTMEMTPLDITTEMEKAVDSFQTRFGYVFPPTSPFDTEAHQEFGQSALSNLFGGLGYFHGDLQVDGVDPIENDERESNFWEKLEEARKQAEPKTLGPYELFAHTPSRMQFPRGFLWDEGFHLLLKLPWDADSALDILQSWLALMDSDGWIAREQTLGPELRHQPPGEHQEQSQAIANPPTLFWVVSQFIDILTGKVEYSGHESKYLEQPDQSDALLRRMYPLLKRHYEWFRRTQSADVEAHSIPRASLSEGYRWRGRTPNGNLASGLDDYPRAEPPDPTELHLDALCWVGVMARILTQIAEYLERDSDIPTYQTHLKAITHNIEVIHWSEQHNQYCDTRVYDDTHDYYCPKGYIALWPLITGFLGPNHPHLNASLNLIRDATILWTDYGVRSLSPDHPAYMTAGNYWRSPIWVNINYMILSSLHRLGTTPGPLKIRCRAIYRELRYNLITNAFRNYQASHSVWEQYDAETGQGQQTQGFAGWSALVVRIMAMPTLEGDDREGVRERFLGAVQDAKERRGVSLSAVCVVLLLGACLYRGRRRVGGLVRRVVRRWGGGSSRGRREVGG